MAVIYYTILFLFCAQNAFCALTKTSPACMIAKYNEPFVMPCSTDLQRPVAWRYKIPENNYAKYLFLFNKLKGYASTLGITGLNTTSRGQYDLLFNKTKITTACEYQCQDNDGMNHGPVTDVVVIKENPRCFVNVSDSEIYMQCIVNYRRPGVADLFGWFIDGNPLTNCTLNIFPADETWTSVVTNCTAEYNFNAEYTFVASFRNSLYQACTLSWTYYNNVVFVPKINKPMYVLNDQFVLVPQRLVSLKNTTNTWLTEFKNKPMYSLVFGMICGLIVFGIFVLIVWLIIRKVKRNSDKYKQLDNS